MNVQTTYGKELSEIYEDLAMIRRVSPKLADKLVKDVRKAIINCKQEDVYNFFSDMELEAKYGKLEPCEMTLGEIMLSLDIKKGEEKQLIAKAYNLIAEGYFREILDLPPEMVPPVDLEKLMMIHSMEPKTFAVILAVLRHYGIATIEKEKYEVKDEMWVRHCFTYASYFENVMLIFPDKKE